MLMSSPGRCCFTCMGEISWPSYVMYPLMCDPPVAAPKAAAKADGRLWAASSPGKRWTEVFFLLYSPFWIIWALCILVPFKLYDVNAPTMCSCSRNH